MTTTRSRHHPSFSWLPACPRVTLPCSMTLRIGSVSRTYMLASDYSRQMSGSRHRTRGIFQLTHGSAAVLSWHEHGVMGAEGGGRFLYSGTYRLHVKNNLRDGLCQLLGMTSVRWLDFVLAWVMQVSRVVWSRMYPPIFLSPHYEIALLWCPMILLNSFSRNIFAFL